MLAQPLAYQSAQSQPLGPRQQSLWARLPFAGMWTAWRKRRTYKALLDLDEHLLDDIGVTRGEVEINAGLPLSRNAAVDLKHMATARRLMKM